MIRRGAVLAGVLVTIAQASVAFAQDVPLIDVYTMGQGDELVEKFGHAAICVVYDDPGRDNCYNYGSTDFSRPMKLAWDFLRGRSAFWVSTRKPERMIERYQRIDRTIWRQTIPLPDDRAIEIARRLAHNALPDNKHYVYHHYDENCSTRVRDIVDEMTDQVMSKNAVRLDVTYRDLTRTGIAEQTWLLLVSDLLIGRSLDAVPDTYDASFLPRYLREQIRVHLGVEAELIYERAGPAYSDDVGCGGRGALVFLCMLFSVPALLSLRTRKFRRLSRALSLTPSLLIMLIIWTGAIVSSIPELRFNEALLVFFPGDLAVLFLRPSRRRAYARFRIASLVAISLLSAVGVFLQPLAASILLPMVPLLIVALDRKEPDELDHRDEDAHRLEVVDEDERVDSGEGRHGDGGIGAAAQTPKQQDAEGDESELDGHESDGAP